VDDLEAVQVEVHLVDDLDEVLVQALVEVEVLDDIKVRNRKTKKHFTEL
jgi:hypothetical protein